MTAALRLCAHCGGTLSHAASCPERGGYELADAPDPEAPNRTLRRVRRVDPLRGLAWMADRHWAAAERLRADHDLAYGYRESAGEAVRVDRAPGGAHYAAAQLDALRTLARLAEGRIMTPAEWDVAQYVVIHWTSLRATADALGVDRDRAAVRLREGLERLGDYYG